MVWIFRRRAFGAVLGGLFSIIAAAGGATAQAQHGVVRTYYIAADEVDWDYLPDRTDKMMGMAPSGYAKAYTQSGPNLIGHVYRKAVYREYTDATFKHLKLRSQQDGYLGILGPIIHAEVGDTIKVVFQNHGTHPYSMHPHGVLYEKASEGAGYSDGVAASAKGGDSVAPGATFTYTWEVPERAGPGPADPSSIVWLYHSHVSERKDVNAGLIGAIVVTRQGKARPDGTPMDVDREFVSLFMIFDENRSLLIGDSIQKFMKNPKKVNKLENKPLDIEGEVDPILGTGFLAANFRGTINGYSFANGPMPTMKKGDHVRWYLITVGEGFNAHTPHWHGNTVLVNGQRTDVVALLPSQMVTADMIPDDPGIWLYHCHVSEHMEGGMASRYQVLP